MTISELTMTRRQKAARAQELIDLGEREDRMLTPEEEREFDECIEQIERCTQRIKTASRVQDFSKGTGRITDPGQPDNPNGDGPAMRTSDAPKWKDIHGREVRTYGPGERMRRVELERHNGEGPLNLGRCLKAMATGRWDDCSDYERRTMLGGTLTAGGYLLPSPLSNEVIDLARSQMTVFAAGARVVGMESDTLDLARVTGDATMGYKGESSAFTESAMTFDRIRFVAKTFGCFVPVSRELIEDAANSEQVIVDALTKKIAVDWDNHLINGDGTSTYGGLTGLKSLAQNTVTSVGSPSNWTKWLSGLQAVLEDNYTPNSYLLCPRDYIKLSSLQAATSDVYMTPPPAIAKMTQFVTTALPVTEGAGANESSSYMGDFTKYLVAVRQGITMEFTTESDTAFKNHELWIKVYMRYDCNVADGKAFARLSGILA